MSDWNEYQDALKKTDEQTRKKIRSSLISDCVAAAVTKYELDASHTKILVRIYVDVLLDLVTPETAIEQIRSAAIPAAAEVHAEIWECIQTIQPEFIDSSQQITNQHAGNASEIPTPETSQMRDNSLKSDIAETEAALNAIPKIRTMVQDAQESAIHTSSQSELLDTNSRWGTKPE